MELRTRTLATVTTVVVAVAAYVAYYGIKYGMHAASPAEAWMAAKLKRHELDRELIKIVGHAEVIRNAQS